MRNRDKKGRFIKGHIVSDKMRKKQSEIHKGKHHLRETREKMSKARWGEKNHNYGKRFPKEIREKISKARRGQCLGPSNPNWKDGVTPLISSLRKIDEYRQWRMLCLKRDWFRCQECFSKENLEVHHIKSFSKLLSEFLKEYDQFSPVEDKETLVRLAFKYKPFWNIDNGQTLCEKHHKSLRRIEAKEK